MYYIIYNDIRSADLGVHVAQRIYIPTGRMRYDDMIIPGQDGTLTQNDEGLEDIVIPVKLNFLHHGQPGGWQEMLRHIKAWLLEPEGGKLKVSYDPEVFYKIKRVSIADGNRAGQNAGEISVEFTAAPYAYYDSGDRFLSPDECKLNPWHESRPTYKIMGEGVATLIINGRSIRANVGQNIIIDTDRMLVYREDGTVQNVAVTGDIGELVLRHGDNSIAITAGFDLLIQPHWRSL